MRMPTYQHQRYRSGGFSLVEVIVVSALIALVFGGLFAGVRLMVELIGQSKAESGARSLAVARVEYIRSLPYDEVGTVGGIPEGDLPQTSTTTLNGIEYTERLLVQYLDRPEDGFGTDDENGIQEDSKVVKVEYEWELRGETESISITTDVIPNGIESTSGGGTLFINVFDASVQPVAGASVHVYNDTGTSTIDVTVTTNENGIANFPGAPARSGYQVSATKNGFSTDQTYSATPENPNPNPPHVSVIENEVSTVNFAIDLLSTLTLRTVAPAEGETEFSDSFDDSSQIYSFSNTTITGGALVLAGGEGSYASLGDAYSIGVAPSPDSWSKFDFTGSVTADTSYVVRLYTVSGSGTSTTYSLVSDTDLPGNSAGFTEGTVDISGLDPATYPQLALGAELTSANVNETPSIETWEIRYVGGSGVGGSQEPIDDVTIDIAGAKSIGENAGTPVLKYETSVTTGGSGEVVASDLEWDVYTITIDGVAEGYDIVDATGVLPYILEPGVNEELTLVLTDHTTNSLHVTVTDTANQPISGATVTLAASGYDDEQNTSSYGQVYFGGVSADTYTLTVSATGYSPYTDSNVQVSGTTMTTVTLTDA